MTTYEVQGGVQTSPMTGLVPHLTGKSLASGFGSSSTTEQVTKDYDGSGKVAIITGASAGLGAESTRVLAARGCHVIMAVRDTSKGQKVADAIKSQHPSASISVQALDLSSMASVKAFADTFIATKQRLDILLCNAGIMMCPFSLSPDGYELQFATNHLGHFLLINLLKQTMIDTAVTNSTEGRIVVLSSSAHFSSYPGGIAFDKLKSGAGYSIFPAYGQSKLANVLFTREMNLQLKDAPVACVCCHPGVITTELGRHLGFVYQFFGTVLRPMFKSVSQGAATQVYLATAAEVQRGQYYADCNIMPSSPFSQDAELGRKLWEVSVEACQSYLP